MPDKTKISTTHAAQTTKINNGNVAVKQVIVKKPPKPLFVLFVYGGSGFWEFRLAANYKSLRLEKEYPNAEIRIIRGFKYPSEFKAEWTKLYNELTNPKTASKYALWEVHYFGHGGPEALYLKKQNGKSEISFNNEDNMECLPWHPEKGIFVLHSCRGAAYEDTFNKNKISAKSCLAKTISQQQKTRCLGQTIYANYAIDLIKRSNFYREGFSFEQKTTAAEDVERHKYRPARFFNFMASLDPIDRVLWGYALLSGDTYDKMLINRNDYKKNLSTQGVKSPIYPIYNEIMKLGPKNQIMPCRVFNNGDLENRIVKVDVFNQNDLKYI